MAGHVPVISNQLNFNKRRFITKRAHLKGERRVFVSDLVSEKAAAFGFGDGRRTTKQDMNDSWC